MTPITELFRGAFPSGSLRKTQVSARSASLLKRMESVIKAKGGHTKYWIIWCCIVVEVLVSFVLNICLQHY
uniref:Uncharacterized protein n=1 Tax=Anguilla anguilla TaxID=7936 RepID=A0A0E9PXY7_ANGAN